jgi:hypothetical protein
MVIADAWKESLLNSKSSFLKKMIVLVVDVEE